MKGSFIGGVLLVTGSCIGAGMLAIPITTGLAGFYPSLIAFLLVWAFMTVTGLLMVEVQSSFHERVNIVSMAEKTLGPVGKIVSWVLYLFLFYSILVAYITGSGSLGATYLKMSFGWSLPNWIPALVFTAIFGALAYQGTRVVDHWNRFFMAGKIVTYLAMVFFGLRCFNPALLEHAVPSKIFLSIPVLVIAFGYHNMVPVLMNYLDNDAKKLRSIIWIGSFSALIIYLVWNLVVLGIVPVDGPWGIRESMEKGRQASDAVAGILGLSWITTFAEGLAFFALCSSFLAQTLGLVHFWADALKVKSQKHETVSLCLLALAPPLIFAFLYPDLFIKAIGFAGGFCAVILFGILPALMAWKGRYVRKIETPYRVKGGKKLLLGIIGFALLVTVIQAINMNLSFI